MSDHLSLVREILSDIFVYIHYVNKCIESYFYNGHSEPWLGPKLCTTCRVMEGLCPRTDPEYNVASAAF